MRGAGDAVIKPNYHPPFPRRGGEPSNLVLLCKKCHLENPNVSDPEIMWDWLKAYRTSLYNTFGIIQGFKEYKKIYGVSFSEQVMKLGISKVEELEPLIASKMEGCTRHFGESHLNKATFAGILRMIYKEIVKDRQNLRNAKISRKS